MPVLFKDVFQNGSIIGVWHITESVEELIQNVHLSCSESESLNSYKHENRKKQWLSYRVLIQELVGEKYDISYSDFGKPYLNLEKKNNHISITHSGDHSAVIINAHSYVGIDIEKPSKRIERVSGRFLSDDELAFIDLGNKWDHLTICWTVKEALFKIHGNLCYDFREQIIIESFSFAQSGQVNCIILGDNDQHEYCVKYTKINGFYLAYVTA
ncbi:MAG: 4'-phosphopantetheinyl transferase superfamily protein [Bacteroidota bacterium]